MPPLLLEAADKPPVDLGKIVERSLKKVFDRKRKEGMLDADLWEANTRAIWQSVQQGWKYIERATYASPEHIKLIQMRENVAVFNVFKNHEYQQKVADALFDEKGKLRKWSDFKKEALKVSSNYNKRYLQAEYQAARSLGRSAAQWQKYDSEKEHYPYLTFETVGDGRVRDSHALLDGVTYPIDDPFWNTYFPPIGWRCRCRAKQSSKDGKRAKGLPDVHPVFRNNPGKTGMVFTQDHPYFKAKAAVGAQLDSFLARVGIPRAVQIMENIRAFNRLERSKYSDIGTNSRSGGWYAISKEADKQDLHLNKKYASEMINLKPDAVIIREHINKDGIKNPEAIINMKIADFKTPDYRSYKSATGPIKNLAVNGVKQGCRHVVIHMESKYSLAQIIEGVRKAFFFANRNGVKLEVLDIKFRNENLVRITVKEVESGLYLKMLKEGFVAPK